MTVVTREQYFEAAMDLLASEGFGAVKISPLCRRFGVTVGSFYHYFDNVESFVDELLLFWEERQTNRIEVLAAVPAEPVQRVQRMKELALTLPHTAEAAIRSWASVNPRVAVVQARVDEHRRVALQRVIEGVVADRRAAKHLSVVGITLLVGLQQWRSPVKRAELTRVFDEFEQTIVRHAARAAVERAG